MFLFFNFKIKYPEILYTVINELMKINNKNEIR